MSKERIRPSQYRSAEPVLDTEPLALNAVQQEEISSLYEGLGKYKQGSIITGTILNVSSDGVLVDIDYKSDGLIHLYEFSHHELKRLQPGSSIEVMLDVLENPN